MTDWENYESGPFCRHWNDPADCDLNCVTCGHKCAMHEFAGDTPCFEAACACKAYVDPEDA